MKFEDIELPTNRSFGIVFCIIFLLASVYFFIKDKAALSILLIVFANVFFLVSLVRPQLLLPINKLWIYFGFILGKIVSPIVLGLIFFSIFTLQ